MAVFALATSAASAQEPPLVKGDNPQFISWSKFKKGTSITVKTTNTIREMTTESTITTTLVEVGTDKLVLQMVFANNAGGKELKIPPVKIEVPRKVLVPKDSKTDAKKPEKPDGTFEEGKETLKIGAVELKTTWYKYKTDVAGTKTEGKRWVCEDIPDWRVKEEFTSTGGAGQGNTPATMKMELIEFKKR